LVLTAVFSLGSLAAFAQEQETMQDDTQKEETMMDESDEKMDKAKKKEMKKAQKGFKEVSVDELPEPVSTAIKEDYAGATLDKVMVNKKEQYKLEATMQDGSSQTMMMDKNGNPIQQ
ncbi:MAG: hypothetical protein WA913_00515, partial [Pricia sp.]